MGNLDSNKTESPAANPYQAPASPIDIPSDLAPIHGASQYGPYRDPSTIGKLVIMALIVEMTASTANSWLLYNFFLQHIGGISADTYDAIYNISIVTWIVCGILFLFWTAKIVRNAWAVRPHPYHMNISPRWAAGFFFVPIAAYWYPYKAIMQARRECGIPGSPIYLWWWILWLVVEIPTFLAMSEIEINLLTYASEVLYLVDAVLAILVVQRITTHQSRMATEGVPHQDLPKL